MIAPRAYPFAAMALLAACASAPPSAVHRPVRPAWTDAERADVLAVPRTGGNSVRVTLWLSVGAADSSPPAVATITAWALAEAREQSGSTPVNAARAITAHVDAQTTRFETACELDSLTECISALSNAVFRGTFDEAAIARGRRRLWNERTRMAESPVDVAERLSLLALFPGAERRWSPLGTSDEDPDLTLARAQQYYERSLARAPRLVVAEGEVTTAALDAAVRGAGLPPRPAGVEPELGEELDADDTAAASRVRAALGTEARTVVSAWLPDLPSAAWVASAVRERLPFGLRARVYGAGGGGVVAVHLANQAAESEAIERRALVDAVATAAADSALLDTHPPAPEHAAALGAHWANVVRRGATVRRAMIRGATDGAGPRVAVGAVVANASGAAGVQASERELGAWLGAHEHAVGTALENGAKFLVEGRPHDARTTILVQLLAPQAGGSAALPSGMSSVLAELLASSCGERARTLLARAHGRARAFVLPAGGWGAAFTGDSAAWIDLVEGATHCLGRLGLRDAELSQARTRAFAKAHTTPLEQRWAAELLAPEYPAQMNPAGLPDDIRELGDAEVLRAWAAQVTPRALRFVVVGSAPVEAVASALRTRALTMTASAPATKASPPSSTAAPSVTEILPRSFESTNAGEMRVVIGFRQAAPVPADVRERCTEAFASAWRGTGFAVTWQRSGAVPGGAWSALGLALPTALANSLREVTRRRVEDAVAALSREAPPAAVARDSLDRAMTLAAAPDATSNGAGDVEPAPPDVAAAQCAALLGGAPRFVIAHPETPAAGP